ncbi:ABC transporter substrate-binding protein [Microbacterium jejuense]|uniref:ABC transporter substrate-binding protein n=1 Tax=Microbacterium jejuense TaxID=1263637 RepID=UPI0031EA065E
MNKRVAIVSMAVIAAVGLSGCTAGSNTPAEGETPSVVVWVDSVREPAAKAYQDSVKGDVDVTIEVIDTTELVTKISLANTTGSGWPDVVFAGAPNDVAILADPSNGYAADLSKTLDKSVFDDYNGANSWCEIEGDFYCLKNDLAQTVLWYDAPLFDELGLTVPTTMEEFATEAMKLQGTGYVAGAIGDQNFYASYLWPSGCPMAAAQDAATVRIDPDAPECERVADLVQPLVDAGVLDTRSSFDAGFLADVAQKGKVAMTFGPSWFGEFVLRPESSWAIPAGHVAAAPMPKWGDSEEAYSGEWGGGIWMASSHAKFPEAAAEAVVFLATDPEMLTDSVTFPGSGPAFEAWAERVSGDEYYAVDPVPAMVAQATLINPGEKPVRFDIQGQIGSVLATEITGGAPVADAIRKFQESLIQLAPASGYKVVQ